MRVIVVAKIRVNKQRFYFELGESTLAYTLYRREPSIVSSTNTESKPKSESNPKRIVLLHGAGVAGELTWAFIANYLKCWDEILVPDLLGMGESYHEESDKLGFTIADICGSLFSLFRHHQWFEFDLVGYSLGGLVALELNREAKLELGNVSRPDFLIRKLGLIEPALFSDQSLQAALSFRQSFIPIAANIKLNPDVDEHFIDFLDLVSPKRKRSLQMDKMAVGRLKKRPYGFANALAAVSHYAEQLDEYKLDSLIAAIPTGIGIVGGLSNPGLLQAQQKIRLQQSKWQIEVLANTDHSLVYVRPKIIAKLLNEHLS